VRVQDTVGIPRGGYAKSCMRSAAATLPRGRVEPPSKEYINVQTESTNHQEQSVNLEP
jgi:hypothetical protein